jgi:multisubunit Na+/H+ antiporter MnhE subunit
MFAAFELLSYISTNKLYIFEITLGFKYIYILFVEICESNSNCYK